MSPQCTFQWFVNDQLVDRSNIWRWLSSKHWRAIRRFHFHRKSVGVFRSSSFEGYLKLLEERIDMFLQGTKTLDRCSAMMTINLENDQIMDSTTHLTFQSHSNKSEELNSSSFFSIARLDQHRTRVDQHWSHSDSRLWENYLLSWEHDDRFEESSHNDELEILCWKWPLEGNWFISTSCAP